MSGSFRQFISDAVRFFEIPNDNPELVEANLAAFNRQVPMMYGLVMANTVALAITHYDNAPTLLTVTLPALLCAICLMRTLVWWQSQYRVPTHADAIKRLRSTVLFAGLLGTGFSAWSLSLFPYGDAYAQGHVAFFMAVTAISCGFCLMHLRTAALLVMTLVVVPFAIFFGSSGNPVLVSFAINFVMVAIAVVVMLLTNNRGFEQCINAQKALVAKQAELQVMNDVNFRYVNVDSLTGLPNRRRFFDELEQRMTIAAEIDNRLVVGILDLDGFKQINDVHGHRIGDHLLQQVGARLRAGLADSTFLARLGCDEFVMIRTRDISEQRLIGEAKRLTELLSAPFEIDGRTIRIGCSTGFAMFPSAAKTPEELFERAEYALHFVKQHDRGSAVIFSAEHEASIRDASLIDQALLIANLNDELWVAYQPITDVITGRTTAFEALARWTSPTLGPISPMRFITAAERSGSICQLTPLLLRKALEGAAQWPEDIRISFNLSALDVGSALSMLRIVNVVRQSGFDPARIDFEITETAVMRNRSHATDALTILKAMGSRISLDDFGTGYSSLSCIRELPLDKVKIDRSFIKNIENDPAARMILKTMVGLCSNLKLDFVVEGVETPEQLRLLRGKGCRFIQGYLFAKPMTGDQVAGYLAGCDGAKIKAIGS